MPEGHSDNKQLPRQGRSPERLSVAPQHFYRTAALPCPYLPGKIERKLVTELAGRHAASFYNELSRAGFRRSHHLAYRPACVGCNACVPVRIPVAVFSESKSLKRIRNLNRDLFPRPLEADATLEQFRLFQRYQRSRHADSDMAAMTFGDYQAMIEDSPVAVDDLHGIHVQSSSTGHGYKSKRESVGSAAFLCPDIFGIVDLLQLFVFEFGTGFFTREIGVVELHDLVVKLARLLLVGVARADNLGYGILQ